MKQARNISIVSSGILLMLLIFDTKHAMLGANIGIQLCLKTVIPSLFPFLFLSIYFTTTIGNHDSVILRNTSRLMHIPCTSASVLIPAFLGGYPVGAKCVADLYHNGTLNKQQAERMLAFSSNAGPSFLFGMVSASFPDILTVWELWFTHIAAAIFTAQLFPPPTEKNKKLSSSTDPVPRSDTMLSAVKAMASICGWIIVFRTLITFLNDKLLFILPQWLQVLTSGFLELSNGCCELSRIPNENLRFILCSSMLSFGGICVLFQTASVVNGLSLRYYVLGKLIQTVVSLVLCLVFRIRYGILIAGAGFVIGAIFILGKNKTGNLNAIPV